MPISSGSSITAAYYNSLQTSISAVLGTGSGDKGYGQTVTSAQIPSGAIKAADWNNLVADVNKCYQHQTGTANFLASVSGGIAASVINNYETTINTVTTNRLTAAATSMMLTSSASSVTRAKAWSGDANASFSLDFGSVANARAFFNTGGEIRLALSHPVNAKPQDANWQTALAGVGTISFKANTTTRTGTLGTAKSAVGYYQLTSTDALIFDGTNIGTGAYSANDVMVYARVPLGSSQLVITAYLLDQHANSFYDLVSAGTVATISHLKATAVMAGIASPTFQAPTFNSSSNP